LDRIATHAPLGQVGATQGGVQGLDGGELLFPRLDGRAAELGDELGGREAGLACGGVRDGRRDDRGLQVGARRAERTRDPLVGHPLGQLGRGDPRQQLTDGDAQGER
jgi:hypothetical protein